MAGAPKTESANVSSNAIAYSISELCHYIDQTTEKAGAIPIAMRTLIAEFSHKMTSGLLPLNEAETLIFKMIPNIGKDWPLLTAGQPPTHGNKSDYYSHLAWSLIAEGVAQAHVETALVRSILALGTSEILSSFE